MVYVGLVKLILKRKAIKSRAIILTFDDGPGGRLTPELLRILAQSNAKATFFLLGRNITGREKIVQQIADQGHEICSHGYDHLHYCKVSPFRALADMKRGWEAINTALESGRKRYPFRPPYGSLSFVCLVYLLVCRVPIVCWSIDSGDTWRTMPDVDRAALVAKKDGGGVCLTHDFDRKDDNRHKYVLDVTRSIINTAKANNMSLLTFSELLDGTK